MAKVIEGLYYSESHEFIRVEGDFGFIGITDFAQKALGNVVYVDMPDVDDEVNAGEEFGVRTPDAHNQSTGGRRRRVEVVRGAPKSRPEHVRGRILG